MTQVPTYKQLVNPTLEALRQSGGSATNQEIADRVAHDLQLSDETVDQLHGNGPMTELKYRLHWMRTYLKKSGFITNSARGVWSLVGQPGTVDPDKVVGAFKEAQGSQPGIGPDELSDADTPDGGQAAPNWQEQLIAALLEMSPNAFERLCSRMLRESGFVEVTVTGRSGDGGIDGHGIMRMGGLISFPVFFQCKRYSGSVTPSIVRDFRGAMAGRSEKGLLITTGTFTRSARQEATRDGVPPIDLIDGNLLAEKLKEFGLGVKTETVEQVTVDTAFFEGI